MDIPGGYDAKALKRDNKIMSRKRNHSRERLPEP
jgi:hypothetical protein